jgi:hypothetical protein
MVTRCDMIERGMNICQNCGKKTAHELLGADLPPKDFRTCSRCQRTVCSDCIDWTAGARNEIICGQCSGRNSPRQGGCE